MTVSTDKERIVSDPPTFKEFAIAIVREVRTQEVADPLAPIDLKLIDNLEQRLKGHFSATLNHALIVSEKLATLSASDPEVERVMKMTNQELAS